MVEVQQAVKIAKETFEQLFGDRNYSDVGLEEVEISDDNTVWIVTLGFDEPFPDPRVPFENPLTKELGKDVIRRFKTIKIDAEMGSLRSLKDRES